MSLYLPYSPNKIGCSVRHQLERRPNTIGCIGLRQSLSYPLRRSPASAMSRYNHRWIELSQCFDRLWNDGLEQGSCQMKSPQYGINLLHPIGVKLRMVEVNNQVTTNDSCEKIAVGRNLLQ